MNLKFYKMREMAKMPPQTSKVADETDKDEDIFIG